MTRTAVRVLVCGALTLTALLALRAQDPVGTVLIKEIAPSEARAGQTLVASGENLGADRVKALYLTDGKKDYQVKILEQGKGSIQFRVPDNIPEGRMRAAVVSGDVMLDLPVFVRILPSAN